MLLGGDVFMDDNKIFLTQEGLDEFKAEIDKLKEKLALIQIEKSEAYSGAIGDGWHDNFAYEDAKRNEDSVVSQINYLVEKTNHIEIIDLGGYFHNKVNINDMVELKFKYEDGSIDIDKFKLTGNWKSKDCDNYQEITLNSPLGQTIYLKEIGSEVKYIVNDKLIIVDILTKII